MVQQLDGNLVRRSAKDALTPQNCLTFVTSRSDDLSVNEIVRSLGMREEVRDLDVAIEALNVDKDKASRDLKAAKKEQATFSGRITKLDKSIEQLEERVEAKESGTPWRFPQKKKKKALVRLPSSPQG